MIFKLEQLRISSTKGSCVEVVLEKSRNFVLSPLQTWSFDGSSFALASSKMLWGGGACWRPSSLSFHFLLDSLLDNLPEFNRVHKMRNSIMKSEIREMPWEMIQLEWTKSLHLSILGLLLGEWRRIYEFRKRNSHTFLSRSENLSIYCCSSSEAPFCWETQIISFLDFEKHSLLPVWIFPFVKKESDMDFAGFFVLSPSYSSDF